MGRIVMASCSHCAYTVTDLHVGAGIVNYTTHNEVACHCTGCAKLATANVLAEQLRCSACGGEEIELYRAYHDDWSRNMNPHVAPRLAPTLGIGRHICPCCRENALGFVPAGVWD